MATQDRLDALIFVTAVVNQTIAEAGQVLLPWIQEVFWVSKNHSLFTLSESIKSSALSFSPQPWEVQKCYWASRRN